MTINHKEHNESNNRSNLARHSTNQDENRLGEEFSRKLNQLQSLGRGVGAFINGFEFNIDRDNGAVQINLRKKTRPQVELKPLLQHCEEIYPLQAIIGWEKRQAPMTWSADQSTQHLLISGAPRAGKTGLLRSLILTLVLATRPSQLQLAIIDGSCHGGNSYDHSGLIKFSRLPHLLNRPPANPDEVCEIIDFIAKEADHRLNTSVITPPILLVIDNLQDILPVAGAEFHQQLEHILDIGPQTGIQVILATNRPEDGRLQDLVSSINIDRITGKMQSAGQAKFASGKHNSEAEQLDGNGEFLATLGSKDFHFQAAWVSEKQLRHYLGYLNRPKQPTLVAWSIPTEEDNEYGQSEPQAVPDFQYGFLETQTATKEVVEETFQENEPVFFEENQEDEAFDDDDGEGGEEEEHHTQLENIYTKLSEFRQEKNEVTSHKANYQRHAGPTSKEEKEAEPFNYEYEQLEGDPRQLRFSVHEPQSDYQVRNIRPIDDAAGFESSNSKSADEMTREIMVPEGDTGENDYLEDEADVENISFEDEAETDDKHDALFSSPAVSVPKIRRRSHLPKPKTKINETEPFDPWQNGLDDLEVETPSTDPVRPALKRPPRLVQRKSPTIRRRVAKPKSKITPKPKLKPVNDNVFDQDTPNGETE